MGTLDAAEPAMPQRLPENVVANLRLMLLHFVLRSSNIIASSCIQIVTEACGAAAADRPPDWILKQAFESVEPCGGRNSKAIRNGGTGNKYPPPNDPRIFGQGRECGTLAG